MTDKVQIDQSPGAIRVTPAALPDAPDVAMMILLELRAIRAAIITIACESGRSKPSDFSPDNFTIVEEQEN